LPDSAQVFTKNGVELEVLSEYDSEFILVKGKEKLVTGQEAEVVTGEKRNTHKVQVCSSAHEK
jgi:hypothetical protein